MGSSIVYVPVDRQPRQTQTHYEKWTEPSPKPYPANLAIAITSSMQLAVLSSKLIHGPLCYVCFMTGHEQLTWSVFGDERIL